MSWIRPQSYRYSFMIFHSGPFLRTPEGCHLRHASRLSWLLHQELHVGGLLLGYNQASRPCRDTIYIIATRYSKTSFR